MIVAYPDAEVRDAVGDIVGVEPVLWDPASDADAPVGAEVVVASYLGPAQSLSRVAEVAACRLVQLQSAGYDGVLDVVPEHVEVANAAGVFDAPTAELAVGLVLASLRGIPEAVQAAGHGTWADLGRRESLTGKRVLIVGYGLIGKAIARRLHPFEVELSAVASSPRPGDDLVAEVHGISNVHDLLPHHDVVVVITPLNASTEGLVDDAFLRGMPDGSLLVNVARGPVVDTDAVIQHAQRMRFSLDVTDPEPLPDDHPLWSLPSVLITPHIGGNTSARLPHIAALIRSQVSRLLGGDSPEHLVRPIVKT